MPRVSIVLLACLCAVGRAAAQQSSPAFEIELVRNCEVVVPAACNGGVERFTIFSGGTWRAALRGASPTRQGSLDGAQLSAVQSAVRQLASAGATLPSPCEPRPMAPQTLETVSVQLSGSAIVLYGSGGKIDPRCGGLGSPAAQLFSAAEVRLP